MPINPIYNDIEMGTAWAEDAATTIPSVPVPGIAYRNTGLSEETVGTGQQYDSIGRSADWNELLYKISANIITLQRGGATLLWISGRQYEQGSLVKDPNNAQIYYRLKAGAGTTRPSSDTTNWQLLQSFFMGQGLQLNGNKIHWGVAAATSGDLNDIIQPGIYRLGPSLTNLPTDIEGAASGYYGFLMVFSSAFSGTAVVNQIAYQEANKFSMNVRFKNNANTWSEWQRFGVNFTLDWNSGHDYRVGDLVRDTSNSLLYVCTTAISNSTQRPGLDSTHFSNLAAWLCRGTHGLLPNGNTNEDTLSWGYSGYSISDCNEILYPGVYYCLSTTENIPSSSSAQGILISVTNGNPATTKDYIILQLFLQASTIARAYCRLVSVHYNGVATFNAWRELSQFDSLDFVSGQTYNQGQLVRGSNNIHYVKKTAASVCNTEPNSDSANFETLAQNLIDQGLLVIGNKINWGNCNAVAQEDLNTCTESGVYYADGDTKNIPYSNVRGFAITVRSSNSGSYTSIQMFIASNTGVYIRTYAVNSSWASWIKIGPANEVPIGTIVAFSGTFGGTGNRFPIPLGESEPDLNWCICDGATTNGLPVPDLRGRFIMGASSTYAAGSTGGSEEHSHSLSGTASETTLTVKQLAAHTHNQHDAQYTVGYGGGPSGGEAWSRSKTVATSSTGGSQPHTHDLDGTIGNGNSLPPYFALALIMRIS